MCNADVAAVRLAAATLRRHQSRGLWPHAGETVRSPISTGASTTLPASNPDFTPPIVQLSVGLTSSFSLSSNNTVPFARFSAGPPIPPAHVSVTLPISVLQVSLSVGSFVASPASGSEKSTTSSHGSSRTDSQFSAPVQVFCPSQSTAFSQFSPFLTLMLP